MRIPLRILWNLWTISSDLDEWLTPRSWVSITISLWKFVAEINATNYPTCLHNMAKSQLFTVVGNFWEYKAVALRRVWGGLTRDLVTDSLPAPSFPECGWWAEQGTWNTYDLHHHSLSHCEGWYQGGNSWIYLPSPATMEIHFFSARGTPLDYDFFVPRSYLWTGVCTCRIANLQNKVLIKMKKKRTGAFEWADAA